MKKLILRNKKGFTLIELIVVIVIIAILAAIAIPSMIGFRKDANISSAQSNARTAYTALTAAAANESNTFAAGTNMNITALKGGSDYQKKVAELLGEGFPGTLSWTISGSNITTVTWINDKGGTVTYDAASGDFRPAPTNF